MRRTTQLDLEKEMARVAARMRARAERDVFGGRSLSRPALLAFMAEHTVDHAPTRTRLLLTRDVGYHTSGWWKNPLYERCYHLSLSPFPPSIVLARPVVAELDKKLHVAWVRAFFGDDCDKLWAEPPYSPEGRASNVWHHRLFCDEAWTPILPHGEVYTRTLTEAGFQSSSEVLEGLLKEETADARKLDA